MIRSNVFLASLSQAHTYVIKSHPPLGSFKIKIPGERTSGLCVTATGFAAGSCAGDAYGNMSSVGAAAKT